MSTRNPSKHALLAALAGSVALSALATFSRAELPKLIDLALDAADVTATGASNADHSGFSIVSGDVNGDGRDELIVLAYWAHWTGLGSQRIGEIDIIWGTTFPDDGDLPFSQDSPAFARVFGTTTQAWVSNIAGGDFNGDGNFDFIWGQPSGPSQDFDGYGVAYVILGASTFPDTLDIGDNPSEVITLLGATHQRGHLGRASCGCDLNGDGFDDIVVAAPTVFAEVFVVWGKTTFLPVYDMDGTPPGVTRISDKVPNTNLGASIACADFDRDGYDDLVLGSSGFPHPDSLEVTILYGRPQFPDSIAFPDLTYRMTRIYDSGYVGSSIAIGDHDGDGHLDLGLANGVADPLGCRDCGEAYVIFKVASLPDSVWLGDTQPLRIIGTGMNTYYGTEILMEDLTGDSRDDLVVVGLGDFNSPTSIDQTVIVYGSAAPPDSVLVASDATITRIRGPSHGVDLGRGLAAGDFDGDGVADLALGAHDFQSATGRTYVFFGSSMLSDTNLARNPKLALRQNYPNPFNPSTAITYSVPHAAHVQLAIYDVGGRRVATLVDQRQGPGEYTAQWDGRNTEGLQSGSGVYFCRLTVDDASASMKVVLLR